jgi:haloalkane dehalogenase
MPDLHDITLVGQDRGGEIGPGVVVAEPERFARVLISNGIMHTAEAERAGRLPPGYSVHAINDNEVCVGKDMLSWIARSQRMKGFKASQSLRLCTERQPEQVKAGCNAPFPEEDHMVACRMFAMLIPLRPYDEAAILNRKTWRAVADFDKPWLTVFGNSDPCTGGWDQIYQERVPGARGQPHVTLERAGHFLDEDRPKEFAKITLDFIRSA